MSVGLERQLGLCKVWDWQQSRFCGQVLLDLENKHHRNIITQISYQCLHSIDTSCYNTSLTSTVNLPVLCGWWKHFNLEIMMVLSRLYGVHTVLKQWSAGPVKVKGAQSITYCETFYNKIKKYVIIYIGCHLLNVIMR